MTAIATKVGLAQSDAELVAASRGGNREAFGQIVRRYSGLISGLIYSACGDLSASEDIAQETFLAAWQSLSGLREPQKLAAWRCQLGRPPPLEISEETGRQRLARGRQMLREQVAAMLERNLARSAPSAQFASAVVAALPALAAQSAAAAAGGGVG